MIKTQWVKKITVSILVLGMFTVFTSCNTQKPRPENNNLNEAVIRVRGAIIPHHNLVGKFIDEFYNSIADEQIERVIILSPNHYGLGHDYLLTTKNLKSSVLIDNETIDKLLLTKSLTVERVGFAAEHGLMVHIKRLEKTMPNAKVVPIMLRWKTPPEYLDRFVQEIKKNVDMEKTLIIASIDFSHYLTEETAVKNDNRTRKWLQDWAKNSSSRISFAEIWKLEKSLKMDTAKSTAMDSPEAFYIIASLLNPPQNVEIWKRTSSLSLVGGEDPMQNTSHLFVKIQ